MSYSTVALLQADVDFLRRAAACAALEHVEIDPYQWAINNSWNMAAMPGFGEAYESALVSEIERPGNDPGVISDQQILAAVQSLNTP